MPAKGISGKEDTDKGEVMGRWVRPPEGPGMGGHETQTQALIQWDRDWVW